MSSDFDVNSAIEGYSRIYDFRKDYLMNNNLPIKPLLIEFKNIINQRLNLMVDNKFEISHFQNLILNVNQYPIFKDVLINLSVEEKGIYLQLIEIGDVKKLYSTSYSNNSVSRILKHKTKKVVKFIYKKF